MRTTRSSDRIAFMFRARISVRGKKQPENVNYYFHEMSAFRRALLVLSFSVSFIICFLTFIDTNWYCISDASAFSVLI